MSGRSSRSPAASNARSTSEIAASPDGTRVYENRGVIVGQMRWGRMVEYEVFEDTHAVEAFDAWLSEHEPTA